MTQHFKIRKNGNIEGMCPKDNKIKHNSVCKKCDDCLSFNAHLRIPYLIICKGGGVEGYTYSPIKKKQDNDQEVDNHCLKISIRN